MSNSGYHDCPCRDCFEIAIGETDLGESVVPALCFDCKRAGCSIDGDSDCLAERGDEHDGLLVEVVAIPEALAGRGGTPYAGDDLTIGERLTVRYVDSACDYCEAERPDGTEVRVFGFSKYLRVALVTRAQSRKLERGVK